MLHHITQRGNRRQPTFFCEEDYAAYLEVRAHERTGRVLGDDKFQKRLEKKRGPRLTTEAGPQEPL
jgi:putative transposase